jgi:aryl-alcohol dehydrogenase-like predicted oxidoreductase
VQALQIFAADHDMTVSQLAIAWTLANAAVDVAIVGARQPAHIEDSLRAADIAFTEADLEQIDATMRFAVPVAGPSPEGMP